jgi:hypothetical protein
VQIVYRVTQEDFESASWLALHKGPILRALQFYFRIGFIGLWVGVCLIPVFASPTLRNLLEACVFSGFGLALFFWQLFFTRLRFRRAYRRSATLHRHTQLGIDDSGLHVVTPESDSRSTWRAYLKYSENRSVFIIYHVGNVIFVMIPKRELTVTQIDDVRSILAAHLPRK